MNVKKQHTHTEETDDSSEILTWFGVIEQPATGPQRDEHGSEWDEVVRTLGKHFHESDIEAARVLYAAVAAHDLKGQPVWLMLIAPPGSMKSELLGALGGLPRVHLIDSVTPKTFISGQIPEGKPSRPASLLHRIGESGIIVCSDFSTVLAMKADERSAVMAELRKIFDGKLTKEFGTTEEVPGWEGRITLIVAVTPKIDELYGVIQSLGDRFVMVRWHRGGIEATKRAMRQDIDAARRDLKSAVHMLLNNLPKGHVEMPTEIADHIAAVAELCVTARTHVQRGNDKKITNDPEPESSTRLAQQLCQLACASARLDHRAVVNRQDFGISKRAGFDCIPPTRRKVLEALISGGSADLSASTKHYAVEDLRLLGLMEGDQLSASAWELLNQMEPDVRSKQNRQGFTKSPPHANDRINTDPDKEVGGTSGESASEGGVL